MRRDTFKLLVFAGIVAFAVLYGMELSSKGIQDVRGSWDSGSQAVNSTDGQTGANEAWVLPAPSKKQTVSKVESTASASRKTIDDTLYYDWENEEFGIPRIDRKPIVDRVSGKTAGVLHDLSKNGIKMVVSIFSKVTE
jgi:hypothetical protein